MHVSLIHICDRLHVTLPHGKSSRYWNSLKPARVARRYTSPVQCSSADYRGRGCLPKCDVTGWTLRKKTGSPCAWAPGRSTSRALFAEPGTHGVLPHRRWEHSACRVRLSSTGSRPGASRRSRAGRVGSEWRASRRSTGASATGLGRRRRRTPPASGISRTRTGRGRQWWNSRASPNL